MDHSTANFLDKLLSKHVAIHQQILQLWINNVLFTWRWWIGIFVTILVWVAWFIWHKKGSTYRLLTAGLFVMIVSMMADTIGVESGTWSYHFELFPFTPGYFPTDLSMLPVIIMWLIQIKPTMNPLVKGIIFGGLSAFVGEPFFVLIGVYIPKHWSHWYSFLIYIVIFLIANSLAHRKSYDPIK